MTVKLAHVMHVDWTSERWFRMCARKVRYGTVQKAQRRGAKHKLRAYACDYCGGFHLTSQESS